MAMPTVLPLVIPVRPFGTGCCARGRLFSNTSHPFRCMYYVSWLVLARDLPERVWDTEWHDAGTREE